MDAIKMNNAAVYESVSIQLSPENFPIAYDNKLKELIDVNAFETKRAAERWLNETPIELELYYEPGYGLFGVEAEAVENMTVKSPYSGSPILEESEIDHFNENEADNVPQYTRNEICSMLTDDTIRSIMEISTKSVMEISNNNQEILDDKIKEIREFIFEKITGKRLKK